jgi:ribosomal protein S18 acetylase RimI-like enzyme
MNPMIEVRLLTEADRLPAATVFVRAFSDKMAALLGDHVDRAEQLFAELITPGPSSWVALAEGRVVGVALCKDHLHRSRGKADWRVFRRHLPVAAAARAWLVAYYLFTARFSRGAMYVDSMGVDPEWEGRGVAAALLSFVADEARRRGLTSLTLYVIDRNQHARGVYEHLGFRKVSTLHTKLFGPLVGFRTTDYMEKRLGDAPSR